MPSTPFCAKAVYEQRTWRVFGLRLWPLPLRDSAGLAPVFPHCMQYIRVPAHQERHYRKTRSCRIAPALASVNAASGLILAPCVGMRPRL